MSLRETLQQNQSIVAVAALVVIVGCVVWMVRRNSGNTGQPGQVYFYDLGDGALFPADRMTQPPIDAPKGGAGKGVRALVFSCGECTKSELKVAYLSKFTPEALAVIKNTAAPSQQPVSAKSLDPNAGEIINKGTMVAAPVSGGAEPVWVSQTTPEGSALVAQASSKLCGGKPPKPCFP